MRRSRGHERRLGLDLWLAAALIGALTALLPLMMGQRTPETLTATLMLMTLLALAAGVLTVRNPDIGLPDGWWLVVAGLMTAMVAVQVWPSTGLARWLGPYPEPVWQHPEFLPRHWAPDVGAALRGWSAFIALFIIAWLGRSLPRACRHWIWLAVVAMALFQGLYGLLSHAAGAQTIFGIWERNNPDFVHGSFSNRNLYAAYLALTWPLAVGIWFIRDMPGTGRLPSELRVAAAVICGAIIGAAMLGSASRLGAAAGVFGILLALILWGRHRQMIYGASAWPAYMAAAAALVGATWYGLTPLAERLLATSGEEFRLEAFGIILREFPWQWWIHGVGLGGFEAAFKPFQPAHATGWLDYAHNDLLQWLVEMGVVGLVILGIIATALIRKARLSTERIALYACLAALCIVALGDFSWHIPATQVVLAFYIGVLLR